MSYLEELNESQRIAVENIFGPTWSLQALDPEKRESSPIVSRIC